MTFDVLVTFEFGKFQNLIEHFSNLQKKIVVTSLSDRVGRSSWVLNALEMVDLSTGEGLSKVSSIEMSVNIAAKKLLVFWQSVTDLGAPVLIPAHTPEVDRQPSCQARAGFDSRSSGESW